MATKVQSKNYLPGYHSMQDIKEDATSSWSSFYQDKKLSEHIYDTYAPRLVNGYSEHDKEMLKQTMLKHEAIFRKQVYELHRLYRIQKDLMDEFQSRGFHRSSVPAEASHSNSFSSQRQSEHTEKTSQVSSRFPGGNASYGKIPFVVTERPQFNCKREDKIRSDQLSFMNGTFQKVTEEVNDKPQKKRTFDLQLPADVYIDVEDTDVSGQMNIAEPSHSARIHKNGTCSLYSGNGMKLTLGNGHNVDQQISNSAILSNKSARGTVDLNEPTTEVSSESPANSASDQLHGWKTYSEYNHGHHSSMRSNANFTVRHGYQQIPPDLVHKDARTAGGWPFFNHESGKNRIILDKFAQTFYNSNLPTPSETVQLNAKKRRESFPFDRNTPDASSRQEPTQEIKTSLRFPHMACSNSSLVSPSVPSAIITPQTDQTSCASSFVSSWRRPSSSKGNLPVAAQALPCFSGSSNLSNESLSSKIDAQSSVTYCQKWKSSWDIRTTILGTDIMAPRANVFHNGLHLDSNAIAIPKAVSCKAEQADDYKANLHGHLPGSNHVKYFQSRDLKAPINLNLNQAFPSSIEDRHTSRQDLVFCDVYDSLSGGPSWLKKASNGESVDAKKTSRLDLSFSSEHPQHILSSDAVASDMERKEEEDLEFSICNQKRVASALQFKHHKMQGNEVFDNGKRTICVPIHEKNEQDSIPDSNGHVKKQSTDNTKFMENDKIFTDLSCDTKMLDSQKAVRIDDGIGEVCGAKSSAGLRSRFNLNSEFPYADEPISSEIVPQGEVAVRSLSKSISIFGAKIASDTDLEAPKLGIVNQHKFNQSGKEDVSDEKEYFCNTLVRLAADSLVSISMASNDNSDESGSCSLSLPQFSTLCWFADVVSSTAEGPKTGGSGVDGYTDSLDDSHDDGLDLFEAMTLELEEIKEDQRWCSPKQAENKDDDEEKEDGEVTGAASLLFTKPRRGQARKRRQRRDFQKDILPGLASLSRHEVSEDLQTIGGMMKASGRQWHTGLTRRNAGRNGANSHTKGRRQPRNLASTVEEEEEEVEATLPHEPSHHSNSEIGCAKGSSMIGWGRTTRRCRRQRCLPGSLPSPLA